MATPDKEAAGTRAAATQHHEFAMSRTTFVSFISHLVDGYPNPEEPMPPGPWDPVIRRALERAILRFGPLPDPWRPSMLDRVALNPQPLPPKVALAVTLAEEIVDRAVLIDQVAGGDNAPGPSAGTKYIADFIEDWCGTRPKRPPRPPKRSPFELLIIGASFERIAAGISNESLRQSVVDGAETLMSTGLAAL